MVINVCLAGATGWAGSELARSIAKTADLTLVAAVSRKHAGRSLGEVLAEPRLTCPIYPSATEALANPCDVLVEYTKPDSAKWEIIDYAPGMPDQKLTVRHDSGSSARPYVTLIGALLAIRKVSTLVGLRRGLDSVLDL